MNTKLKIGAIILLAIVIVIGGLWIFDNQFSKTPYEIAKNFVSNEVGDDWVLLENVSQIPYQEGNKKDPKNYENVVKPNISAINSDTFLITLYTWTKYEGVLVKWEITIKDNKVTHQYAEVIDKAIGGYTPVPFEGSHLPEPGRVLIDVDVK